MGNSDNVSKLSSTFYSQVPEKYKYKPRTETLQSIQEFGLTAKEGNFFLHDKDHCRANKSNAKNINYILYE